MIRLAPPCKRIIADGRKLFAELSATFTNSRAIDWGEEHHVAVAAASICAKVRRDELFACIAAGYAHEFGQVGGHGYTNAATRLFTRAYVKKYGRRPPEARQSWPGPRHGGVGGIASSRRFPPASRATSEGRLRRTGRLKRHDARTPSPDPDNR